MIDLEPETPPARWTPVLVSGYGTQAPPPAATSWPFGMPLLYRWFSVYFTIYFVSGFLGLVPGFAWVNQLWFTPAWRRLVDWTALKVWDTTITAWPMGSGDTTWNYVEVFVMAVITTVIAIIWTCVDYRRRSYPWLLDFSRVYVRFSIGFIMVGYGFAKVFPGGQFAEPEVSQLMKTYGDSSPMNLLWTFMGASPAYTFIAGAAEVTGGVLLFFRRTTLLGSLITAGVMINVAALNFCYDVPVKLFSTHLVVAALYLAAPDFPRLFRVLFSHRAIGPGVIEPPWGNVAVKWSLFGVKMLVVIYVLGMQVWGGLQMREMFGPTAQRGMLDGTWEIKSFMRSGVSHPPLLTDDIRWRYLTIYQRPMLTRVGSTSMSGAMAGFHLTVKPGGSPETGTLLFEVYAPEGTPMYGGMKAPPPPSIVPPVGTLEYEILPDGKMKLEGSYQGAQVAVTLERKLPSQYLLMNRGFNWINEYPFNR